tara:strand:+ start:193 stop:765 length:573 start_codon:yes stop_codon:yes gene_type:complete
VYFWPIYNKYVKESNPLYYHGYTLYRFGSLSSHIVTLGNDLISFSIPFILSQSVQHDEKMFLLCDGKFKDNDLEVVIDFSKEHRTIFKTCTVEDVFLNFERTHLLFFSNDVPVNEVGETILSYHEKVDRFIIVANIYSDNWTSTYSVCREFVDSTDQWNIFELWPENNGLIVLSKPVQFQKTVPGHPMRL